jgi:hypothetical protein
MDDLSDKPVSLPLTPDEIDQLRAWTLGYVRYAFPAAEAGVQEQLVSKILEGVAWLYAFSCPSVLQGIRWWERSYVACSYAAMR